MSDTGVRDVRGRLAAASRILAVLLVVVGEFVILTMVYHSGDGSKDRLAAVDAVNVAESAWTPGQSVATVASNVAKLDQVAGDRAASVSVLSAAWVADPTPARFAPLQTATSSLDRKLSDERAGADRRVALIHALLLALASVGWFFWFRGVVRRQRQLQRNLTEARVAMAGEKRLTALVQNSADMVLVVEPNATVSFASPSIESVLGKPSASALGRPVTELLETDSSLLVTGVLAGGGPGDHPVTLDARHADGRGLVLEGTLTNLLAEQTVNGWVLTLRDATERLALQAQLSHQALHDALTGLSNRELFTERLSHALRARAGQLRSLVVLFMDVDDFKTVNDSLGHAAGDELLVEFGKRLQDTVREGDTVARLGGDEFAILMEDSDLADAQMVADRLVSAMAEPVLAAGSTLPTVRASIGLAVATPGHTTAEEALRNADVAMYFAKDRGKGQVAIYDSELHTTALRKLEVRAELSEALQSGHLEVFYQATVDLLTGGVDGYEALVRWRHPTRGLVFPGDFIEVAEQSGLIVPLGRWVLREACRAAVERLTLDDAAPVMAVNISPRQIAEASFHDEVVEVLRDTGLDPSRLVLEITESTLLDDRSAVVETLERLRAIGVHIAIDDFGTGYSSLSYLADLPVDILKIDKSFVDGIGHGGESLAEAVIALSSSLNLVTLAEGVEEPEQALWLIDAGCRVGQGYLWAKPVPLEEARMVLLRNRDVRPAGQQPIPVRQPV